MAQPIQFQSQLPQLLTQLLGSKQTSSSSPGVTTPLEELFASSMAASSAGTPEMQQLIASIFQEGATKVPELTQAFANATGSRTTGNSGLQLALSDLNRQLSTAAATAVLQNQTQNRQIAGQAASGIAQATRGSTQTQQSKTGINPLAMTLLGTGVNKLDKLGKLDWLKSGSMAPVTDAVPVAVSDIPFSNVSDTFPEFSQPFTDFGSSGIDVGSSGIDFGADVGGAFVDQFDIGGFDAGGFDIGLDAGIPAFDYDFFDPGFGTGADFGSFDLGDFFADGGHVGRKRMMQPRGYADGGNPMQRNRNYMGTPTRVAPQIRANNVMPMRPRPQPVRQQGTNAADDANTGAGDAISVPSVVGDPATNNAAALGFAIAAMLGPVGIPGLTSVANAALGGKSLPSLAISNVLAALGVTGGDPGDAGDGGNANNASPTTASVTVGQGFADDADATAPSAPGSVGTVSESIGIGGEGTAAGGGTGPGGSGGSGSGVGADGSATSGVDGDSGVGSTGAYRDGGKVKGPGTGTSDSIPARLSDGEYIIPADVVRRLGTNTLDRLISGHIPAGVSMR